MSTHVVGIRKADDSYKKKLKAYKACLDAGVDPPPELSVYFGDLKEPNPKGMEVDIEESPAVERFSADYQEGFDVDVTKLPKDVTVIRFYNSY